LHRVDCYNKSNKGSKTYAADLNEALSAKSDSTIFIYLSAFF